MNYELLDQHLATLSDRELARIARGQTDTMETPWMIAQAMRSKALAELRRRHPPGTSE